MLAVGLSGAIANPAACTYPGIGAVRELGAGKAHAATPFIGPEVPAAFGDATMWAFVAAAARAARPRPL